MSTKVVWSNSPELGLGPGYSGSRPSALPSLIPVSGSIPFQAAWPRQGLHAIHVLWDLERVLSKPQVFFFYYYHFLEKISLCIWLHWVLVVACVTFNLSCSRWDL